MPIRIRPDRNRSPQQQRHSSNSNSRRSSGGGILGAVLPLALNLFKKNPKLGIIALIAFGIYYWYSSKSEGNSTVNTLIEQVFSTGMNMDEKVYDKAEVFEALADNIKNPLPEEVSLLAYAPSRKNQGKQGSCVGWASAYAARTILYAKQTGAEPNRVRFSPSFVYNQIALKNCQGSYMHKAMDVMLNRGALPYSAFAYDENSCSNKPDRREIEQAKQFKTKGFNRLTKSGDNYKTDLLAIKQNLSQGAPVVIGMMVGGSFMTQMNGRKVWKPTRSDYQQRGFGGHAMCVIGYDDYLEGGAFQIMNSWGEKWGEKGIFWIKYNDFDHFTKEAYGLYPMGDAKAVETTRLKGELGIQVQANGKYLAFDKQTDIGFSSRQRLTKQADFKIEITNSLECYTYIIGEETDGSSYVLFPYTKKHSPYCGITGTRLFPKDHSLYPDDVGSKDQFAVIISKQKLDYKALNSEINAANGSNFEQKIKRAMGTELISGTDLFDGETIAFDSKNGNGNMIAIVLEINK
ncbi:MAG: C1 family peptidase [Flavobacteriales bacterium]